MHAMPHTRAAMSECCTEVDYVDALQDPMVLIIFALEF